MSKKIEERYIKLSHREHILSRPDTYIGSLELNKKFTFVPNYSDSIMKMEYKEVEYSPAFLKCFDEIISNSSDHSIRTGKVSYIKVNIENNYIFVENDGDGIPVVNHKEHNIYIPEMIFGNLLAGENFNDNDERYVSGRNGIGGKATNIFSTKFIVETSDGKKSYYQEFSNNMSDKSKPVIKKCNKNYTSIKYYPDFEKFKMVGLNDDIKLLMEKRVYDIAAYNPKVKVYLNDKLINVNNFKDYIKLFSDSEDIFYEKINDNWEIGVIKSPIDDFTQVSMVNGIHTILGGTHVNHISNQIVNDLKPILSRGVKNVNIKLTDIKNRMLLFVSCKLPNPTFNTQTKETLTLKLNANLISDVVVSENFIKKLSKSQIFDDIVQMALLKEQLEAQKALNKETNKRIRIDKLVDANKAGKIGQSDKCNIFFTEGDSALSFAISGFKYTGRDYYGAFPLKGKPLNVRDIPLSKIKENEEIIKIFQILGLEFGKKYNSTESLRYGKIVILTDADCIDGETIIRTLDGDKKIKNVSYDDKILTHTGQYKSILNIIETQKEKYVEITINNEFFKFSELHKLIINRNDEIIEIYAKDILPTDLLLFKKEINSHMWLYTSDYNFIKPEDIQLKSTTNEFFYDITVEDDKTFFIVTKNNELLLTHNCDGTHIAGLLINLFDCFFPELLKNDFIYQFITPIVSASKGKIKKYFYKLKDFDKWKTTTDYKTYSIKYYKGLGSCTKEMIKDIFTDIDKHLIRFNYTKEKETSNAIDLAFNKKRADDRKDWLSNYVVNSKFDKLAQKTTYESFYANEFVEFSMADNVRSIPCIMDGKKPAQRKILYTLLKLNKNGEINVGELFGFVKATADYHHGPMSLEESIINMAQDYIGSNNLPILEPIGSFGTRMFGGKDSASPRYINTKLSNITKTIFIDDDNNIITYLEGDTKTIEPMFYIPIIPIILVNGAEGIGTGWSTTIPKYNINDIITYIENKLSGKKKNIELLPYYNKFKGTIYYDVETDNCITTGIINKINDTTLNIVELPINVWNDNYYKILEDMIDNNMIKSYIKECTDEDVNIKIKLTKETLDNIDDYITTFKLTSRINMSNMHLFDINGKIKKYQTVYDIIDEYYENRLPFYQLRKDYMLKTLVDKENKYENIMKFLKMYIDEKIKINKVPYDVIIKSLEDNKFDKIDNSFSYLLNIPIYKLSKEELDKINKNLNDVKNEIKIIKDTTLEKMWHNDLINLKKELKK